MPTANVNTSSVTSTESNRRMSSSRPPQQQQQPNTPPGAAATAMSTAVQGQHDAADAAMYKEMRAALADFESQHNMVTAPSVTSHAQAASLPTQQHQQTCKPHPRHKAFYSALRSVLTQVLDEKTENGRHMRLLAGHQWYIKHKPRTQPTDMNMAAAMAASLSVVCPQTSSTARATAAAAAAQNVTEDGASRSNRQQPADERSAVQQHDAVDNNNNRTARWLQVQQQHHSVDDLQDLTQPEPLLTVASSTSGAQQQQQWQQQQQQQCLGSLPGSLRLSDGVYGIRTSGCSMDPPHVSGQVGAAAVSLDGLIPLGSLPSCRFPFNSHSSSGGNHSCKHSSCYSSSTGGSNISNISYAASKAQWQLVSVAQQRVEAAVATEMQGYNRYRARVEEEISRKQEADMHMARRSNSQQCALDKQNNNGGVTNPPYQQRALMHLDSQHQPSQVSASYQWVNSSVHELVPVDKIKEAKKQYLQESACEVSEVAGQLAGLGLAADPEVLQRALMPIPDQAYMVCLARLPKPGLPENLRDKVHVKPMGKKKSKKKGTQANQKA